MNINGGGGHIEMRGRQVRVRFVWGWKFSLKFENPAHKVGDNVSYKNYLSPIFSYKISYENCLSPIFSYEISYKKLWS